MNPLRGFFLLRAKERRSKRENPILIEPDLFLCISAPLRTMRDFAMGSEEAISLSPFTLLIS
jgi:hypothetical protein